MLWREFELAIAIMVVKREEFGIDGPHGAGVEAQIGKHALELVEALYVLIFRPKGSRSRQVLNDWEKRTVAMVW